jgi:NDMA-dependent alcohol dehydrogenase
VKTRAAVMWEAGKPWDVVELELDPPKAGEVLLKFAASGMCHSDDHLRTGDLPPAAYPMVGGHEGAGVVEQVGEGVLDIAPGDHVVCSFLPTCGRCRWCSTGHQNLCDSGANLLSGSMMDGTFRFHSGEQDLGAMCMLGTFSERAVVSRNSVVKVDDDIPLEKAALVGCGVPTGWGSAVYAAEVKPGETVVIFGIGGIGINAVQGAKHAGARHIIAVDPVEFKREKALEFGATHAVSSGPEAIETAYAVTNGVGADSAIITVGVVDTQVVEEAFNATRKIGTTVVVGLGNIAENTVQINGDILTLFQKTIKGSLFGNSNPMFDIKNILSLYKDGLYKLDELVTKEYTLDQINEGYEDMAAGVNLRGVIRY